MFPFDDADETAIYRAWLALAAAVVKCQNDPDELAAWREFGQRLAARCAGIEGTAHRTNARGIGRMDTSQTESDSITTSQKARRRKRYHDRTHAARRGS